MRVQVPVSQDKPLAMPQRMPYEVAASALTALMQRTLSGRPVILP